jgi:hypothetical protein
VVEVVVAELVIQDQQVLRVLRDLKVFPVW